jgi:hypothetical protein
LEAIAEGELRSVSLRATSDLSSAKIEEWPWSGSLVAASRQRKGLEGLESGTLIDVVFRPQLKIAQASDAIKLFAHL